MRIIKMLTSLDDTELMEYFEGTLSEIRRGKFTINRGTMALGRLSPGEKLLFSHRGFVRYVAEAASPVSPNRNRKRGEGALFFKVKLSTLRRVRRVPLSEVERVAHEYGERKQLSRAQRWPQIEDSRCSEKVWQFVVSEEGKSALSPTESARGIQFKPGCRRKLESTEGHTTKERRRILLRQNQLQRALHKAFCSRYGKDSVGTEIDTGSGARVDLVVRRNGKYHFYEIKAAQGIRMCLREAIGQLLDYSYWPSSTAAERLIVISENALTREGEQYLTALRKRFHIPIYYQRFDLSAKQLAELQ